MINSKTKVLCLIGKPVKHSLSPIIHNVALNDLNLNYVYVAFEIEENQLENAIKGIKALGIKGANVTMPYKTEVFKYLDELSEDAKEIGAVNTILNEDGVLKGYNTDGIGALRALEKFTELNDKKVILLGAGGAAKAIAVTISKKISEITILNRTERKAVEIALKLKEKGFNAKALKLNSKNLRNEIKSAHILINATSVGMNSNESPVPKHLLKPGLVVFDIVYSPLETKLLKNAREKDCITIDGLWMLIYQGAESFKIWTGFYPNVQLMRDAALKMVRK